MAVCFLLKEVIVFLCIVKILKAESDLLESIQLDASNPPELNEFLRNVLQEKQVFSWIRHEARDTDASQSVETPKLRHRQNNAYQNNIQQAIPYNGRTISAIKRNIHNRRPINDVHPYMFESSNDDPDEEEEEAERPAKRSVRKRQRTQKVVSNFPRTRRSKGSVSLDSSNEQGSGEVKIAPRSESGVLNVPGQKYGSKRGVKRTCDDENEVHEMVKNNTGAAANAALKRLDQDISSEYENHNKSCLPVKKAAHLRQNDISNSIPEKYPILPQLPGSPARSMKIETERQVSLQNQIALPQAPQALPQPQAVQPQQLQPQALQQMAKFQQQQAQPLVLPAQIPKYQLEQAAIHQHLEPFPVTSKMSHNKSINTVLAHKHRNLNLNDPKMQDFVNLVSFVDASNSRETSTMSRQDLLRRDNDNVLENIDRVLKSDRSGLGMYHDNPTNIRITPHTKREDTQDNQLSDLVILPLAGRGSFRRSRDVSNDKSVKRMDVDITLNAQPVADYTRDKSKAKRRRVNLEKKTYPKMTSEKIKLTYDTTPSRNVPSNNFPLDNQQTNNVQQQMISNPNLKIMENADDDNDNNLKQTLKAYMNRQNEYNQGKLPENDDEEPATPDYQLVQQKKNMLEDQTEPTSAAEQRELGRKDSHGFVTPSMLNDTDDALIVIPLKKNVQEENSISVKGDPDFSREGFKVKEAKDVIHVRHHVSAKNDIKRKDALDQLEGGDSSAFPKDVFDKVKNDIDISSRSEIKESGENNQIISKKKKKAGDYDRLEEDAKRDAVKEKDDKLEPEKQADANYDDYENFDMKRDTSAVDANSFKSRKLSWIPTDEQEVHQPKIRIKRNIDANDEELKNLPEDDSLRKRSEDDEPDEEPGNDAKEPSQEEKKVQKSTSYNFVPKKEEGEMTLHMDQSDDVKRNGSDNDFPPDDENDGGVGGNGTRKGSKTIISYNFFNITVNMGTTTSSALCNNDTTGPPLPADSPDGAEPERNQTDTQNGGDPNAEPKAAQANRLAQNILNFAARHKSKFNDDGFKSRIDEDKDISRMFTKEQRQESRYQSENNKRGNLKKPYRFNPGIQSSLEDFDSKYMTRSSEEKRDEDTDAELRIKDQIHEIRSAVDNAKNRELIVNKLERLVNSYKTQMQPLVDSEKEVSLDKRSDYKSGVVHHHSSKKKKAQLPLPECVTSEKVPSMQKRVIKAEQTYVKPQEVYYEPESMADDLKEKLLFERIYNRVVKRRKKAPDPFMYKIIDSVFGNEEEGVEEANKCPVEFDDGDGIETPAKRTTTASKELTTTADDDLVDVSRQKKKSSHLEELIDKDNPTSKSPERLNMIKKQINEEPKAKKLDNVDSFKDIIEAPGGKDKKGIRKRDVSKRNLQDFPKTYLSPMDENFGRVKRRKRRRLKNLKGPLKKIRQINYNDYVQSHGFFPTKKFSDRQLGSRVNFNGGQNYNVHDRSRNDNLRNRNAEDEPLPQVKPTIASTAAAPKTTTGSKNVYKVEEKNCSSELDASKVNQSKMIECELQKKEHEDMRRMLNGFLPLRIIDIFYNQLKDDNNLYNRFGGAIGNSKQCASENAHNVKIFREEQAKIDIKHAEEMLHEVIIMLNQIVADQVHRRTCLQLAPNLKLFVIRITKNLRNLKKNYQVAEGYPLPKIKSRADAEIPMGPQEEDQGDFLFDKGEPQIGKDDKGDIHKKIKLIEKLLEKYQSMSGRCQVQVEPVKDYLLKHLGLLMKLMEKAQDSSTCATTTKDHEPIVKEDELSPPHGKINIQKVANINAERLRKSFEMTTADVEADSVSRPPTEVEQRQQKMLEMQQEGEQEMLRQQQLQKRLQNTVNDGQYQQIREVNFDQPQVRESVISLQQPNAPQQVQGLQQLQTQLQPQLQQQQQQQALIQPTDGQGNQTMLTTGNGSTTTVTAMVTQELDPYGKHYTNPEMVSKNLLDMGLDVANTYIPPFDVNGMVQENIIKADMAANAAGTLIPHVSSSPAGKPAPPPANPPVSPPKKRDVFDQEKLYEKVVNAKDLSKDEDESGHMRIPFKKSVTSPYDGRLMSKNQEMQDLLMTDLYSKKLFDRKRSIEETKRKRQAGNVTQGNPVGTIALSGSAQPSNQPSQTQSKGLANYGKEQFIWQPLLISPTLIPDPDIEDTEYYTGHKYSNPEMVNQDLVSMGLDGEVNSYVLPFSLDTVVQSQIKASTQHTDPKFPVVKPATEMKKLRGVEEKPSSHWNVSDKYKRLLDTYRNIREKRQNEKRIGKLYGRKPVATKLESLKSANREMNDISKVSFEKPIVFSLEG